ncbi:MAG: transcription termination/antitermination protein NusG [bacterium]|nr:transcription termination/antitermination protein NusG [bacterium]
MAKAWYVIHTYSGYENKVKTSIEQRLRHLGMGDVVSQILIPTEDVCELKKGQKHVTSKKFFPGYILAEMEMNDEIWYIIKNTPKVTGFVGAGSKPTPMSEKEVETILEQMRTGATKPKAEVLFGKGERVKIIDGPFTSFTGQVDEINEDREKVRVLVSIFGRSTPVELDFGQVEKI